VALLSTVGARPARASLDGDTITLGLGNAGTIQVGPDAVVGAGDEFVVTQPLGTSLVVTHVIDVSSDTITITTTSVGMGGGSTGIRFVFSSLDSASGPITGFEKSSGSNLVLNPTFTDDSITFDLGFFTSPSQPRVTTISIATTPDSDEDGDGVPDANDSCPLDPENDDDGDGFCEVDDNCPSISNINQSDVDGDGIGDACERDSDGDGVADDLDNCPLDAHPNQTDSDGDGVGDICDGDDDNDDVVDGQDVCLDTAADEPVLTNGCSVQQQCECTAPWKNHGAYVSCVARASTDLVGLGLITTAQRSAMVDDAAESSCGQKK
jgi:hypothetical protein